MAKWPHVAPASQPHSPLHHSAAPSVRCDKALVIGHRLCCLGLPDEDNKNPVEKRVKNLKGHPTIEKRQVTNKLISYHELNKQTYTPCFTSITRKLQPEPS